MAKKRAFFKYYKHKGGITCLPNDVIKSPAYKALSAKARCLLLEMQHLWRPQINGRIVFSNKMAQERLNCAENTARDAFRELEKTGFIERILEGNWLKGNAREWRLTYQSYKGREPTNEWRSYN